MAIVATAFFFGWYHIGNEKLFADVVPAILSHFVIDLLVHAVRPLVERSGS